MNLQLDDLKKYSSQEKEAALLQCIRQRYIESLYLTAKDLLDYPDITHYTHDGMVEALQSETKRKLLCVPRGCFKSSLGVVAYPIWCLLKNPNLRILIDSEVYDNSKNFIREIRGKLETPQLTMLFGNFHSSQWAEGSITIAQRTKILKESSITASGVSANKTGQHYDLIIMDDMNSDKNSQTKEARQKIINHYRLNTAILEPSGTIVVIGTRYSADDLIGWILENEIKGFLPPDEKWSGMPTTAEKQRIYMLVGTPGSGKSWVANQVNKRYAHLAHDEYTNTNEYISSIMLRAKESKKPVLIETPFSVSEILNPLIEAGFSVTPLFILESERVTQERYEQREGKAIPQGHLTRIKTYRDRAQQLGAFSGTSEEVLNHLLLAE